MSKSSKSSKSSSVPVITSQGKHDKGAREAAPKNVPASPAAADVKAATDNVPPVVAQPTALDVLKTAAAAAGSKLSADALAALAATPARKQGGSRGLQSGSKPAFAFDALAAVGAVGASMPQLVAGYVAQYPGAKTNTFNNPLRGRAKSGDGLSRLANGNFVLLQYVADLPDSALHLDGQMGRASIAARNAK